MQNKRDTMAGAAASQAMEKPKPTKGTYSQAAVRGADVPSGNDSRHRLRDLEILRDRPTSSSTVIDISPSPRPTRSSSVSHVHEEQKLPSLWNWLAGTDPSKTRTAHKAQVEAEGKERQHHDRHRQETSKYADKKASLEDTTAAYRQQVSYLSQQLREQKQKVDNQTAMIQAMKQHLEEQHRDKVKAIQQAADRQVRLAIEDADLLRHDNNDFRRVCDKNEQEIDALRAQVKKMQEVALSTVEAEVWAPESASDIQRKLKSMNADIKRWSEKYATLPLEYLLAPQPFNRLAPLLLNRRCTVSPVLLREKLGANRTMQKKPGKAAALLLAALTSSVVIREVIAEPFFAFIGDENSPLLRMDDRRSLQAMCNAFLASDEAGAHAWRCQLFRLLDPPNPTPGSHAEHVKNVARASRELASAAFAMDLLNDVRDILVPAAAVDAARPGLEAILLAAADLAMTFWTRKQSVHIRDLTCLALYDQREQSLKFAAGAADLEPHPLHSGDLDDDPQALDGQEVVLLCSPAVLAHGTADGQDYHKNKVWHKATVWLG